MERPLAARGRRDAAAAGRWLVEQGVVPDGVWCSIAVRTRETWKAAVAAGGARLARATPQYVDAIYQAETGALLRLVQTFPDTTTTALLIGHAPGLPGLSAALAPAHAEELIDHFPTSTIAVFALDTRWADIGPGSARLVASAVPRG